MTGAEHPLASEPFEMPGQEGAEYEQPAEQRQRMDRRHRARISRPPHHGRQRLPCREQDDEHQTGAQHICASLHQRRDVPGQHTLEATPRHGTVLSHEEAEQLQVDAKRHRGRPGRAGIDLLGNDDAADETDRVKQRREKDRIDRNAIADAEKSCETSRGRPADAVRPMVNRDGHVVFLSSSNSLRPWGGGVQRSRPSSRSTMPQTARSM
ncbi:hypothetical protein [Bradyrhizobium sp. Ash2021]|uniref:hypothetical protein n=1 Tax=Bradyrhizobium sp. Ash2021 TaxID=2954771 RepID=UPI0028160AC9|nr:hypothetical protein [Bradyrhizobium sp. Ash2021]